jgi:tetratricopeptide (TPR) repeat protein
MSRKFAFVLVILIGFVIPGFLSLSFAPGMSIPLGTESAVFGFGYGGDLAVRYRLPSLRALALGGVAGYEFTTLQMNASLSTISAGAELSLLWEPLAWLGLRIQARGGYFHSFLNDGTGGGGNGFASGGAAASFGLFPGFEVSAEIGYRALFGFSQNLVASLGATYRFAPPVSVEEQLKMMPTPLKGVRLEGIGFDGVFPVFFKYYDNHPIGKAVLRNTEASPLEDLKVTVYVQQYMANPKVCVAPGRLAAGAAASVELYGLFTDKVLGISESTKVSAQIVVEGTMAGKNFRNEYVETLRLYDRNAMSWDDDRKAAAFVTFKDPTVLKLSKNVSSIVRGVAPKVVNRQLVAAIAVHELLALYGMSYIVDPSSAYKDLSQSKETVDYLQFPRQTLEYKAGDCDDLSILYCALLESMGVPTAFITVPGHIYIAFSLKMTPVEAKRLFASSADNLIVRGEEAWIPLEVTSIAEGFLPAWEMGAQQWRENDAGGVARFFPLSEAWAMYEPVGFSAEEAGLQLPPANQISSAFLREVNRLINREVQPQTVKLEAEIKKSNSSPDTVNRLGVMYARYGMIDKAEQTFRSILGKGAFAPAMVNLGNVLLETDRAQEALGIYGQAAQKDPSSRPALLGLALASHRLERYAEAQDYYARLKQADSTLAQRYSFLEIKATDTARAAEAGDEREVGVWVEN